MGKARGVEHYHGWGEPPSGMAKKAVLPLADPTKGWRRNLGASEHYVIFLEEIIKWKEPEAFVRNVEEFFGLIVKIVEQTTPCVKNVLILRRMALSGP